MKLTLRGTGKRRADLPALQTEIAALNGALADLGGQLHTANRLLGQARADKTAALARLARLTADYTLLAQAHTLLEQENGELAADLSNLRAIRPLTPAGQPPIIPTRPYDPDTTAETLWDGSNTIRVGHVRTLAALNTRRGGAA